MSGDAAAVATPFVDLHLHSTASDGSRRPSAVVEAAAAVGLGAIALTDHDTLAGVSEASEAGARLGVRVIAGVELSVVEGGHETHLLGLHLTDVAGMDAALAGLRAARRDRAAEMVEKLNGLGIPVALDTVFAHAGPGAVGRPHVARALVAGGWVRDHREAFDRYIGSGRIAYVAKHRFPMADAIAMVHDAGGLAVLAHPGQEATRARLEALAGQGLDGVEVLHPSHSAEDVARLGALADHGALVRSGGSDWHGAGEGPRTIGNMRVPAAWLARQDEVLAARGPAPAGAQVPTPPVAGAPPGGAG